MSRHYDWTVISAERVKIACERYLAENDAQIAARRERMIEQQMRRRFFRAKTRDEAITRLDCRNSNDEWHMAGHQGGYWALMVRDLLLLAIESEDGRVYVSSDSANLIAPFLPKKEQ